MNINIYSQESGRQQLVEGITVQTWLTGKVSEIVPENQLTEEVKDIPIFNHIRELNKRDIMAVYQCLIQNN